MNTSVMFSSKTDLWATPQDFFNTCNQEFNFNLDACALPENAKCKNYFTPEMDGLKQDWSKYTSIWINPPYGREMSKWIEKAYRTIQNRTEQNRTEQNRTDDRNAFTCKNRYESFSRFYLSQSGDPLY